MIFYNYVKLRYKRLLRIFVKNIVYFHHLGNHKKIYYYKLK